MTTLPSVPPLFLAGPTAVGKSAVAYELAQRLNGEIISVDSMQVYRGLDIGTAKPSLAERSRVPHHLIDVVGLDQSFDAAKFVTLAQSALHEIEARGHVPIFCGGTGLYFQAFWHGLGQAPAGDPLLRAELERLPLNELLAELERADAVTFQRIDRLNRRRVQRAVEVIRLSGRPFSAQRATWSNSSGTSPLEGLAVGLERPRAELGERIDQRVDAIFKAGFVDEVQALLVQGLARNPAALQALGYRQVVEHLQGRISLSQASALLKQKTRQYAKRQMTWFKRQATLNWRLVERHTSLAQIASELATQYHASATRPLPGLHGVEPKIY